MTDSERYILITRPEDQAQDFADDLAHVGFRTLIEPMLKIVVLDFEVPDLSGYQGLMFTSVNAVKIFSAKTSHRHMHVFAVGEKTADMARAKGFSTVYSASGAGEGLAHSISRMTDDKTRPYLHPRASDVAVPLSRWLQSKGIVLEPLTVYKAEKTSEFADECIDALRDGRISCIPFFSKRTAENFIHLVQENGLESSLAAIKSLSISDSVLECVRSCGWKEMHVAATPDQDAMIELIRRICPRG